MKNEENLKPDFSTFRSLAARFRLVPTYKLLPADLETPVTAYLKLSEKKPYGALLESVEGGEKLGRYSFVSISHHFRFESRGRISRVFVPGGERTLPESDPIRALEHFFRSLKPATLHELPRFCGGAVGMIGYDMVRRFERLPETLSPDLDLPDAIFLFTDECIVFDHWKQRMFLIKWNRVPRGKTDLHKLYHASGRALDRIAERLRRHIAPSRTQSGRTRAAAVAVRSNLKAGRYEKIVEKAKEYIRAGDIIQTVLSQRFEVEAKTDPLNAYRALRMVNPSPYLYLLRLNGSAIVGSSPEILVRKEGKSAMTRPIAGTRRRGETEAADERLQKELLRDPKERAEHLMLVDLGRNDLGRCCKAGSIEVPDFMRVERYSHVMHLVSTVRGELRPGEDAFSLLRASFPAGTVTGAPKIRAMEIIEELEAARRGIYAGSVGYFSYAGDMDMAITIRTMLFHRGRIFVQAGAGIVADSIPAREEKETRSKAAALFRALELAQRGFR